MTTNHATLLLVDDEPNVLSTLHRLFRNCGYEVRTAENGVEGLARLCEQPADLVISDMRMPEMGGAEFLAEVAERWPDTLRMIISGVSDLDNTVKAVNEGRIHHYFTKPWDSAVLTMTVRNALERKALEDDRRRLTFLLEQKNSELSELNRSLEQKVSERTATLKASLDELDNANLQLRTQLFDTIRALSRIIELRPGFQLGLGRVIADQAQRVAHTLGLAKKETQDVIFSGLLFQLGRLTLPERLNERPFYALNSKERQQVLTHAQEGAMLLGEIGGLGEVATIIRSQYEKFDGSGIPDRIAGEKIPIGARILAVVRDYNLVMEGAFTGQKKIAADAQNHLVHGSGAAYDPAVVSVFLDVVGRVRKNSYRPIVDAYPYQLIEGMEVYDVTHEGRVYLQGGILDSEYIQKIMALRDELGIHMRIRIKAHM